jgi:hypothetical protein
VEEDVLVSVQPLDHAPLRGEGVEYARGSGPSGEEAACAPHVYCRYRAGWVQLLQKRLAYHITHPYACQEDA